MKILLVTSLFGEGAGGLAIACQKLVDSLLARGHVVQLFMSPEPGIAKVPSAGGNAQVSVPNLTIVRPRLTLVPGGYRPDLVADLGFAASARHVASHCRKSAELCIAFGAGYNGLFAAHVAHKLNIPLVVSLRGSEINLSLSNILLRVANRECLSRAAAAVGLSRELVDHGREIQPETGCDWFVIPNAYELPRLCDPRPLQGGHNATVRMGIASRYLNEKKGIGVALKVLGALTRKYPGFDWRLSLVGKVDDDLRENYQALALAEGIAQQVAFEGLMDRKGWLCEAQSWDLTLQLSPFEGFSNSTVESLAAGVPVLLTNTGYIAEQLRAEVPKLLLPDGPEDTMADGIHAALIQDDLAELNNKAIRHLRPLLAEPHVWEQWQTVFDKVLGPRTTRLPLMPLTITMLLHDVAEYEYSSVALPARQLRAIVDKIAGMGFKLCSAAQFYASSDRSGLIICTFDDAYQGVCEHAYPILREHGFSATVFVPTAYIGQDNGWNPKDTVSRKHMDWGQLGALYRGGWEIGSHGVHHTSFLRLSATEIDESLQQSKELLATSFGDVHAFAYPYGHYSDFVVERVRRHYSCAFATEAGGSHFLVDRYHLRRYAPSEVLMMLEPKQ